MNYKKFSLIILSGILIAVFAMSALNEGDYTLLELKYENHNFSLVNISHYSGNPQEFSTAKDYEIRLIDYLENNIYSLNFDPANLYTDGGNEELDGGLVTLNSSLIYLVIPRYYETEKIIISREGNDIFGAEVYDEASSCRIA